MLDLRHVYLCLGPVSHEGDVNVLLVGSGDPRHILKTIAALKEKQSLHVSSVIIN